MNRRDWRVLALIVGTLGLGCFFYAHSENGTGAHGGLAVALLVLAACLGRRGLRR